MSQLDEGDTLLNPIERLRGFEAQTQWKDPANPDRSWVGRIVYSPVQGVNIEAYIPARNTKDSLTPPSSDFSVINGTGYDGTPYCAVHAFILNSTSHIRVSQQLHIYANELVCGTRLQSTSDKAFISMVLSSPALTQWAVPRRIKRRKTKIGFGFSYSAPRTRTMKLNGIGSGSITWQANIQSDIATGDITASHKAHLNIQFENPKNIDEILDFVYALEMYFCFAATVFSGPPEVYLSEHGISDPLQPTQLLPHAPWFEVAKQVHPLDQYFCVGHLKRSVNRSVSSWIDAFKLLGHGLNPYFVARTMIKELTTKFLYYAQSVEALARDMFPLAEPTAAESKSLEEAIKSGIRAKMNKAFRKQFGSRIYASIKGVGRPQFRERLIDLSIRYKSDFAALCPQFDKIIPKIVRWRNDLTHRNPIIGLSQTEVQELQTASEALRLAAELMILTLARVPSDANKSGLVRSFYHSFGRSQRATAGTRRRTESVEAGANGE